MAKRRRTTRPAPAWRDNAEAAYLLGATDLPPVESFCREAWAIERGHFERLLAADRDLAGLEGREAPEMAIINGTAVIPLHGVLSPSLPWYRLGTSTERFALQLMSALDNPDVSPNRPADQQPRRHCGRHRRAIGPDLPGPRPEADHGLGGQRTDGFGRLLRRLRGGPDRGNAEQSDRLDRCAAGSLRDQRHGGAAGDQGYRARSARVKKLGTEHEPLTDEKQAALFAEILDPFYAQFVAHVARNRGVSEEAVRNGFGRGGVLLAGDALQAGMIDRVGDWNQFLRELSGQDASTPSTFRIRTRAETPAAGEEGVAKDGGDGPQGPSPSEHDDRPESRSHDKPDGSGDPPIISQGGNAVKYSPQTLALLFGAGIISAIDAATDTVTAAVQGFCAARGVTMPTEEAELCKLVKAAMGGQTSPTSPTSQTLPPPPPPPADPTAIRDAIAAERSRVRGIEARAQLLGLAPDAEQVRAAIDGGTTVEAFVTAQVDAAVAGNRPLHPVAGPGGRIDAGPAALDNFVPAAIDALLLRSQAGILAQARANNPGQSQQAEAQTRDAIAAQTRQSQAVREIAAMAWPDIMRQAVQLAGVPVRERSPLGYATAFLSLGGRRTSAVRRRSRRASPAPT